MSEWAVAALLVIAVTSAAVSVAGVAALPGVLNRLHYLVPVSTVGAGAVAVAVIVREQLNARGIKALLVLLMLAVLNPLLAHAVARAARARQEQ